MARTGFRFAHPAVRVDCFFGLSTVFIIEVLSAFFLVSFSFDSSDSPPPLWSPFVANLSCNYCDHFLLPFASIADARFFPILSLLSLDLSVLPDVFSSPPPLQVCLVCCLSATLITKQRRSTIWLREQEQTATKTNRAENSQSRHKDREENKNNSCEDENRMQTARRGRLHMSRTDHLVASGVRTKRRRT